MRSFLVFFVGGLGLSAICLGIGYLARGDEALVQGGTAFGLTFVPAAATLAWVLRSFRSSPEMQLLATLGGSGARMAIALGGGFLLTQARPSDFGVPFWTWLVAFYLVFLGVEITLVVRQAPKLKDTPPEKYMGEPGA